MGLPSAIQAASRYMDVGEIGLRVLAGRPLRWRHRRAGLVVVASDIDADAGVAAVWLDSPGRRRRVIGGICLYERAAGSWQHRGGSLGGGTGFALTRRPSATSDGPALTLTSMSGSSMRSISDWDAADRRDLSAAGKIGCSMFRAAVEVTHMRVGARRVEVPAHGYVIVAWKAPPSSGVSGRPPIAALGADGAVLTELGSGEHIDTLTRSAIDETLGEN